MLSDLLTQIRSNQDIGSVTVDEMYDTRKCHEAIATRDARAMIPQCKKVKPWKLADDGAIARTDAVNAQRYLYHFRATARFDPFVQRQHPDAKIVNQLLTR
jgi:hypothetical protein